MLTLIKGFGRVRNLISVTACIPIPYSASQPIPWGIILINSSLLEEYDIITEAFKWANVSHYLDKENMCRQRGSDDL